MQDLFIPLLEPAVRDNVIVHPPPTIRARFEADQVYSADETRIYTRAWQRFSSSQ
jgi:hypothetical protein